MEKYYYIIRNMINERDSMPTYIADTYEEAEKEIQNHEDWWDTKGSGSIEKVDKHHHCLETWFFRNGKCYSHYDS